jgi:hypothetical protein
MRAFGIAGLDSRSERFFQALSEESHRGFDRPFEKWDNGALERTSI